MSSFARLTKRPGTDRFEMAIWLDNYYGRYRYGVQFPDGTIYPEAGRKWEFDDSLPTPADLRAKFGEP